MGFRSNEYPGEHLQMEMIGFSLSLSVFPFSLFFSPRGRGSALCITHIPLPFHLLSLPAQCL